MKTLIAIAAMILTFGAASAKTPACPAGQAESSMNRVSTQQSIMLDSLQSLSEKTPIRDFANLDEKVKEKVLDMQGVTCE